MPDTDNTNIKKPAPPEVEILKVAPLSIKRPLALLNGHAYAAAWLNVRVKVTESKGDNGKIVKHKKPKITEKQALAIIRDDGTMFSEQEGLGVGTISDTSIQVHLSMIPPEDRLWSSQGVSAYLDGDRPNPHDIFDRITEIINRFIDFDHSLADQKTMSEMIACYILATWFLDGFNVIGFLWPNGERGTGKTQLLIVITELAYLGQLILAGGSFASLRDLAGYGATLGFDDAENLSDPRRTDPDKRSLLLAGNRRGNTVPFKVPVGKRGWQIKYMNTFCARLFSAIRLPDPVLSSRTITVPLIRTPDRYRANADPSDHELWPHDRRTLIDDLWALGLTHLSEIPDQERTVNELARLSGRDLEPWRAILAVALWLDDQGVTGIWDRMEQFSWKYQHEEQQALQTGDLTHLVIQTLVHCAISASKSNSAVTNEWFFPTADITNEVIEIAQNEEIDINLEGITSRKVGRILGKLRFQAKRPDGSGNRGWTIPKGMLEKMCLSYGIPFPNELDKQTILEGFSMDDHLFDGTNGCDGIIGTSRQVSLDEMFSDAVNTDVYVLCNACGSSIGKIHDYGDEYYCASCHSDQESNYWEDENYGL